MKKGDKVYIDKNIQKNYSRNNSWTERNLYGSAVLKKGIKLFHVSGKKLEGFTPVETCFSVNTLELPEGYVYMVKLKKDLKFEHYDNEDYRIDLGSISNDDIEIVYLGTIGVSDIAIVDEFNRVMERYIKLSFAKEFKDIANEMEDKNKKEIDDLWLDNYHKSLGYKKIEL